MARQPSQGSVETQPDDYTIVDSLCSVWRKRGIVFAALVVGALIGIAAVGSSIRLSSAPVSYYISLSGMQIDRQSPDDNGLGVRTEVSYPNGVAFLPRDLTDRQVLQRVREQLGLGNEIDLGKGIDVSFDSPLSEGILKRYKERLAARGLSQADIDALNNDMERDLATANMSGLRIAVSPAALGVSTPVAVAIAKALPQAWREIYTARYRTLLVAGLPNLAAQQDGTDLTSPSGTVAAQMKIVSMMRGLSMMREDNRLAGVMNAAGQTASDLEGDLQQFRTVYFGPFAAGVFASNDPSVASYRKNLDMRLAAARRDAEAVDRTIQDMLNNPMGKGNAQTAPDSNVQMDGTMLSQVLGLAQRASLTPLMPGMFAQREKLGSEIARLENELAMASPESAAAGIPESAPALAAELKRLIDAYRDLYSVAFERLRATSSEFYVDLTTPAVETEAVGARTLALLFTPIVLALIVALAYLVLAGFFLRRSARR